RWVVADNNANSWHSQDVYRPLACVLARIWLVTLRLSMDGQALFGSRIRSLREAASISRERAAENADINSNYLGEIERGEKWPSIEVIQRLADTLSVPPSTFF